MADAAKKRKRRLISLSANRRKGKSLAGANHQGTTEVPRKMPKKPPGEQDASRLKGKRDIRFSREGAHSAKGGKSAIQIPRDRERGGAELG